MVAVLLLCFICLLFVTLQKNKESGLKWAFFTATLFLCIRYDWGNDYLDYLEMFNSYNRLSFDLLDLNQNYGIARNNEYGWIVLNRLFGFLGVGFFGFIIGVSIFESWTLYRVVVKYVEPKYYWVAVLFWIFSTSFCINASMMRQHFCICLYFIVTELMTDKKVKGYLIWSILIILIGTTIHRSFLFTLVSLPLFYIKVNNQKTSIIWLILGVAVFILWSHFGGRILEPIMMEVIENNDDYSSYMKYVGIEKTNALSTGLGQIFRYVMFGIWLWLLPKVEKHNQILIILFLFSYFFEVAAGIVSLAGRLALYYSALNLICWTTLFSSAKKWPILYLLFIIELAILIRAFIGFFYSSVWIENFMHYHTIFEAGHWM